MRMPLEMGRAAATSLSALVVVTLLLAACGGATTPTATPTPTPTVEIKTETFVGTLSPGGSAYYPFSVVATGALTVTLTSLSPQATITVGFGIGQPATTTSGTTSTTTCSLISGAYTESARVGQALSGTIAAGTFCIAIYDVGNLSSANDYVITLSHP